MSYDDTLMELYNIKAKLEHEAAQKFSRGIGLPYTPEIEEIDKQIAQIQKIIPPSPFFKKLMEANNNEQDSKIIDELKRLEELKNEIEERNNNPKKYQKIGRARALKRKNDLEKVYSLIDYSSKAEKGGWEKKWNILQTIWSAYISANRKEELALPEGKLENGISEVECQNILSGLQEKEDFILNWYKKYGNYFFILININDELTNAYNNTKKVYEKFAEIINNKTNSLIGIFSYNPETGDGQLRGRPFRLTDGALYKKLFDECFAIKGKKLAKEKVLEILGLNNNIQQNNTDINAILGVIGDMPARRKSNQEVSITNAINDIIKDIRNKTGLNTKEFVNNKGNITLTI